MSHYKPFQGIVIHRSREKAFWGICYVKYFNVIMSSKVQFDLSGMLAGAQKKVCLPL